MAELEQLNAALLKADAAGDTVNAHVFANRIKALRDGSGTSEAPPPTRATPADAANITGQQAGAAESPTMAAIGQAAHQGTFGLNDYVNAGARYAAQRLSGVEHPDDFSTDVAYSRGKSQGEATGSPIASTIGGVLGTVLGGGAINAGLKAARAIPGIAGLVDAVAPKGAQVINGKLVKPDLATKTANVAKSAAVNAGVGGGLSLANGDDLPTAGRNAAITAVAGPIIGKVAARTADWAAPYATAALGKLVPKFNPDQLSPSSLAAMDTLAKSVNMTRQQLQDAYDSHLKLTGSLPSMAQLADLQSQGSLKALAAANPEIGEVAMTAASAAKQPLDVQLKQAAQDRANLAAMGATGRPQSSQGILNARDTAMDRMMQAKSPAGVALRDEPVSDPTGLLQSAHVDYALRPNTAVNARLNQSSPTLDAIKTGQTTIGDVETIRKALRDQQSAFMRPAPGAASAKDPILAKEFGDIAAKVEGLGTSQHPDYGSALGGYRQVSRYNTGFEHGMGGNAIHEAPDDFTAKDLATPMGQAGYAHGNALNRAQQALDAISPNSVKPATELGPTSAAKAVHAATVPTPSTVASITNHLRGLSLPKAVQGVVARQLFSNDPRVVQQGIANLNRARVSSDDMRQLGAAIGGSAGVGISQYLNGN